MVFLRALCISLSIYSKIPVPIFEWKKEEMKYQLIFFPLVGAVIGVLIFAWSRICNIFSIGSIAYVLIGCAIPVLITGGFHLDGFMDTMDARKSYKPKEEKLMILSDPHIGAFSVIMLLCEGLIYAAAFSEISYELIPAFAACFFVSRSLSGIGIITFPKAKKDGMVRTFSDGANGNNKKIVLSVLTVLFAAGAVLMIITAPIPGLIMLIAVLLTFLYYRFMSIKTFGGITGDTAGYFVVISETVMAVAAAVCSHIIGI